MADNSNNVAVSVKKVSKTFRIPVDGQSGLKHTILNIFKPAKGFREFTPLNSIDFTISKGDFFGIVGKNGSGKSTLLKTIAGIYSPNSGEVTVNGSLVPFIELGVGFNPELTGRENVYLNGALLGFGHKEIDRMYDDIVQFAELEDFMEERLKNYSSGMQVRLAFSIAIKAKGDILLLDEVLAVGDAAFQQKCFDYFEQLKKEKRTIIIVTHDMASVKRFCNRALIIKDGRIEAIGKPTDIADIYTEENIERLNKSQTKEEEKANTDLRLTIQKKRFTSDEELVATISYTPLLDTPTFINLSILKNGNVVADYNTKNSLDLNVKSGKVKFQLTQPLHDLNPGTYDIYLSLHGLKDDHLFEQLQKAATFMIQGYDESRDGPLKLTGKWTML